MSSISEIYISDFERAVVVRSPDSVLISVDVYDRIPCEIKFEYIEELPLGPIKLRYIVVRGHELEQSKNIEKVEYVVLEHSGGCELINLRILFKGRDFDVTADYIRSLRDELLKYFYRRIRGA